MLKIFQPIFVAEALNAANYNTVPALLKAFSVKNFRLNKLFRCIKVASAVYIAVTYPVRLVVLW